VHHRSAQRARGNTSRYADDPLDITLWQLSGWRTGRVTLTRPVVPGPLILAHDGVSAVANMTGATLIGTNFSDGLIYTEQVITGWNVATYGDTVVGGASGRLTGTPLTADWNALMTAQRLQAAGSERAAGRKYVAGVSNNVTGVTEQATLPSTWVDGSTHIVTELEMAGNTLTFRAKILGAGSWAFDQTTTTDTSVTAAGLAGVFFTELELGMAVNIYDFQVTV
jgi:hypothetical protein